MQQMTIKLSLNQLNLILEALGDQPYRQVYDLVAEIRQQAAAQLKGDGLQAEETAAEPRISRVNQNSPA